MNALILQCVPLSSPNLVSGETLRHEKKMKKRKNALILQCVRLSSPNLVPGETLRGTRRTQWCVRRPSVDVRQSAWCRARVARAHSPVRARPSQISVPHGFKKKYTCLKGGGFRSDTEDVAPHFTAPHTKHRRHSAHNIQWCVRRPSADVWQSASRSARVAHARSPALVDGDAPSAKSRDAAE